MLRYTRYLRLGGLISFLGICLSAPPVSAQTPSIVLVQNEQGNYVYINTGKVKLRTPTRALSVREAGGIHAATTKTGGWDAAATAMTATADFVTPAIQNLVQKTAGRMQVDPKLVDAVIRVESAYNPRAVSSKGAMGLMQLIPATAQRFGVENPFDPGQNIRGGVTFMHYLLHRFNGSVPLSLAAYNAGEHRVGRDGEIPPIPETINYVRKVTSIYHSPSAPRAGLPASTPGQLAEPIYRYVDAYGVVHFSND